MAANKPAPSLADTIDPATDYAVRFKALVTVARLKLYPLDDHIVSGAALLTVIAEHGEEVIDDVRPHA